MVKDSPAQIAPADTAIGRPSATARRLVDASVSTNTRRAYAGALGLAASRLARSGYALPPKARGGDSLILIVAKFSS